MPGDVLLDLMMDHWRIEVTLEKLTRADSDQHASLLAQLRDELGAHLVTEEQVLYSAVSRWLPDGIHLVAAGTAQHREMEQLLEAARPRKGNRAVAALAEMFDAHARDEEAELFPRLRDAVDAGQLADLAGALRHAREVLTETVDVRDRALLDLTRGQLYERAKELGIEGRSMMSRDELIRAIERG